MKYRIRIPKKMDLEVTWIHHRKKNGKSSTLTRPFRARAVQGLSGLALLNVDPKWRSGKIVTTEGTGRLSFPMLIWNPGQSKCAKIKLPAFQQVNLTFHQINIDEVRLDVTRLFWFVVQTLK